MPDTIRAELRKLLTTSAVEAASARLREPVRVLARTFQSAIPVVLDGLAACAKDPARLDAVSSLVIAARAGEAIDDLPALIASGKDSELWAAAQQLLDVALPQRAGPTAGHLAKATGVETAAAAGVLTVTAILAMGVIARRIGTAPLGASRIAEILASANERPSIVSAMQRPVKTRSAARTATGGSAAVEPSPAGLLHLRQEAPPARGAVLWLGFVVLAGAGLFIWPDGLTDIRPIIAEPQASRPDHVALRSTPPPRPAPSATRPSEPSAPAPAIAQPNPPGGQPASPSFGRAPPPAALPPASPPPSRAAQGEIAEPPQPAPKATVPTAARIDVVAPPRPAAADLPPPVLPPLPAPRVDTTAMRDDLPASPPIGMATAHPPSMPASLPAESVESRLIGFIEDRARPLDSTIWFDLEGVTFRTGSTALLPGSRGRIDILAEILTVFPSVRLTVAGHTDNQGDPDTNINLAAGRAQSVAAALQQRGIAQERLTVVGLGAQRPLADNAIAMGRARNRRIAVQVTAR